jgi:hypothetical protein
MVKRLDTDRAWRDLWEQVKARSVKSDNPARYMVLFEATLVEIRTRGVDSVADDRLDYTDAVYVAAHDEAIVAWRTIHEWAAQFDEARYSHDDVA